MPDTEQALVINYEAFCQLHLISLWGLAPPIVCPVGDPANKSALSSSSQTGFVTQRRQNTWSPTKVKLKKGHANTGKCTEPIHSGGGARKRVPMTPCCPDPKAAHVSISLPKPRASG